MAPTSGKKPMPVSGMAKAVRSVTMRWRAVHRDADAAAHDDAVHERDIGLREADDAGVRADIRRARRSSAKAGALRPARVERADVAAGAEGALARAVDHDGRDCRVAPRTRRAPREARDIASVSALSAFGRFSVMRPDRASRRTTADAARRLIALPPAEDRARDDQPHDLVGALEDLMHAQVAHDLLDAVLGR